MDYAKLAVDMSLKAWNTYVNRTTKFYDSKTDEDLAKEVAPGKNTLLYLLGHLVAVNDGMISIFGLGEREYAHLDEAFVNNPDKSNLQMPDAATLRTAWTKSNETLTAYFTNMTPGEWHSKHNLMTDEDYAKEPSRNKLSVLVNRTSHIAYHLGQLVLVN